MAPHSHPTLRPCVLLSPPFLTWHKSLIEITQRWHSVFPFFTWLNSFFFLLFLLFDELLMSQITVGWASVRGNLSPSGKPVGQRAWGVNSVQRLHSRPTRFPLFFARITTHNHYFPAFTFLARCMVNFSIFLNLFLCCIIIMHSYFWRWYFCKNT